MAVVIDEDLCVLCGLCTGVCPPNALELTPDRLVVLPNCTGCGWCVPYCPVGAISGGRPVRGRSPPPPSRAPSTAPSGPTVQPLSGRP